MATYDSIKNANQNIIFFTDEGSAVGDFVEYTAARGRMVVGLPSSGTNEGTVGTALTNAQDKQKTLTTTALAEATIPNHQHAHAYWGYASQTNYGSQLSFTKRPNRSCGSDGWVSSTGSPGPYGATNSVGPNVGSGNAHGHGTVDTSDCCAYIQLMAVKGT